jgi:hypothetical protein
MNSETTEPTPEELERRKRWFEWYVDREETHSIVEPQREGDNYRCPCCGCKTLGERGGYEICPVCFWEDDGQDEKDADVVRGGPNASLSLTQARANYREVGACERRFIKNVRKPLAEEF